MGLDQSQLNLILDAVALVAADAREQLAMLPAFVVKVDEIALTFDNAYGVARGLRDEGLLSDEQWRALEEINNRLDVMSGPHNAQVWTDDAVRCDGRWNELRNLARAGLILFGVPGLKPTLNGIAYVADDDVSG